MQHSGEVNSAYCGKKVKTQTCALWQNREHPNLRVVAKIDKYKVAHCGKERDNVRNDMRS
jgi:hypothetical protein